MNEPEAKREYTYDELKLKLQWANDELTGLHNEAFAIAVKKAMSRRQWRLYKKHRDSLGEEIATLRLKILGIEIADFADEVVVVDKTKEQK